MMQTNKQNKQEHRLIAKIVSVGKAIEMSKVATVQCNYTNSRERIQKSQKKPVKQERKRR